MKSYFLICSFFLALLSLFNASSLLGQSSNQRPSQIIDQALEIQNIQDQVEEILEPVVLECREYLEILEPLEVVEVVEVLSEQDPRQACLDKLYKVQASDLYDAYRKNGQAGLINMLKPLALELQNYYQFPASLIIAMQVYKLENIFKSSKARKNFLETNSLTDQEVYSDIMTSSYQFMNTLLKNSLNNSYHPFHRIRAIQSRANRMSAMPNPRHLLFALGADTQDTRYEKSLLQMIQNHQLDRYNDDKNCSGKRPLRVDQTYNPQEALREKDLNKRYMKRLAKYASNQNGSLFDYHGYQDGRYKWVSKEVSCAIQVTRLIEQFQDIHGSAGVVDLVFQLKESGWRTCPKKYMPGAVAYSNDYFGNGPFSHIGLVSNSKRNGSYGILNNNSNTGQMFMDYGSNVRNGWYQKVNFLCPPK